MLDETRPETLAGDWRAAGACLDADPELFFPIGDTESRNMAGRRRTPAGIQADKAIAVCSVCPVRMDCRAWAMRIGPSLDGVWGGLTMDERNSLRRREQRTERGGDPTRNFGTMFAPVQPTRDIIGAALLLGWTPRQIGSAWGMAKEAVQAINSPQVGQKSVRTTTQAAAATWWETVGRGGPPPADVVIGGQA